MPSRTSATSAKAVKAVGKVAPSRNKPGGKGGGKHKRQIPWLAIGAAAVIIALIGALAYNLVPKYREQAELKKYTPSAENQDPSEAIAGVEQKDYPAGLHVDSTQRVAYDQSPAFGGPHDASWANCMGTVYDKAIREENAVHSLEHGAVWITYNPDKVGAADVDKLREKVDGQQYMMMSPYPDQESPISLQAWGRRLAVDSAEDKRIGQFITALRLNSYTYPEVGADCATIVFDTENPPPYDPSPPGPDAVPMDGGGITPDPAEVGGMSGGIPGIPGIPGMPGVPVPGLPGQAPPAAPAEPEAGTGQ
ncbi:DUF3105 domain-containing protein [Nocardia donostiensis]|uniref:DUF3105 domain-containing protein n=1 Tax=Nocardia donostiensis TaxID=1538463 RepID=A0A1W0B6E5_9NOCA|nr:DUF3105 domain-containing protein [Nocardia donostiensis]ONM46972.1 hypothetical protein B0T46_19855 [Nocardia donostiensis]OQS14659.1 hypothetical protein B0T36_14255 [Nocardia donostiensis]OQS18011.1 hypothetical protein B0T44_21805 [Nocardia donostiensis]